LLVLAGLGAAAAGTVATVRRWRNEGRRRVAESSSGRVSRRAARAVLAHGHVVVHISFLDYRFVGR
jgi:hypothetical protein